MQQFIKKHYLLIIVGIVSLYFFMSYFPVIYSLNSINAKYSRSEIARIAEKYLSSKNYDINNFHRLIIFKHDLAVIRYLQRKLGVREANKLFRNELEAVNYWFINYYLNLPRDASQESYNVSLSPSGKIVGFKHSLPDTTAGANISASEALSLCYKFLEHEAQIDLSKYSLEKSTSKKLKNRTDHYFTWIENNPKFEEAKFIIQMGVKGDKISSFNRNLQIPTSDLEKYRQTETGINFVGIIYFIFSFIILVFITVNFLKKYHQGEIGVKHGLVFFMLVLVFGVVSTLNNVKVWSYGAYIGSMSRFQVMLFMTFLLIIFVDLSRALMAFTGWSVGESYAREGWGEKLSAIDGILKGKLFTLNTGYSILRGYFIAFFLLGFFIAFSLVGIKWFHGWTSVSYPLKSLDKSVIFLVPIVEPLLMGISSEIIYRLYFVTYFKRITKSIPFAIFLSALLYMLQPLNLSLFPTTLAVVFSFIMGIILGYYFYKHDILTVIVANSLFFMILSGISLLYLEHYSFQINGIIVTFVIFIPLIIAGISLQRKEVFQYQGDELPPHIRRISERARMAKELEIAKRVQLSLLPRENPQLPGFEIFSTCMPAQEVGGDYYDFVRLSEDKIGIAIGDVSGKGVPAAIYMTLTKGILQSYAEENLSPKKVLSKVNKLMYQSIERDSFVSMFYAILDIKKRALTYARAGHNPAILFKSQYDNYEFLQPNGIGLGLEAGAVFDKTLNEESINLKSGDLLIFYTDGFTEAMNSNLHEYGEQKLIDSIEQNINLNAGELAQAVLTDIKHFMRGYPQHDDMTMIVIKVK